MKLIGELIEAISDRAELDNVRLVGQALQASSRSALVDAGSELMYAGQRAIGAMMHTTGHGEPETGALFSHAQARFTRAGQAMHAARPDAGWGGPAAHSYADQNARQQLRAETLARADREVHRVLYRQAGQVAARRGVLADQAQWLTAAHGTLSPLQFIPRYGKAATLAIEANALQAALGESTRQLHQLLSEVRVNAGELRQAVGRYAGVADAAE